MRTTSFRAIRAHKNRGILCDFIGGFTASTQIRVPPSSTLSARDLRLSMGSYEHSRSSPAAFARVRAG